MKGENCQYYGAHGFRNINTLFVKDIDRFIEVFDNMAEGEEESLFLYFSSRFIKKLECV